MLNQMQQLRICCLFRTWTLTNPYPELTLFGPTLLKKKNQSSFDIRVSHTYGSLIIDILPYAFVRKIMLKPVFRIRKVSLRIRILGSLQLNYLFPTGITHCRFI